MSQLELFNGASGWKRAVAGMTLSYENAPEEWIAAALLAVYNTALEMPELTTDNVWARFPGDVETANGSALGMVMRQAKANGWIASTGRTQLSRRASTHCRPLRIWRSLITRGPLA